MTWAVSKSRPDLGCPNCGSAEIRQFVNDLEQETAFECSRCGARWWPNDDGWMEALWGPENDVAPSLGATSIGMGVAAFSGNQRGELLETDYSRQITTGGGKPGQGYPAVRVGLSVRRLTPLECERLQGFPDGHTAILSDTRRYRTLGNAVAVPVVTWLGRRIVAYEHRRASLAA